MAVTIVETRAITGGVDTHAGTHVAAALDPVGALLGVREFAATPAGYTGLLDWLAGFGTVCLVGIEGTGSYGAGLARYVTAAGIRVVEVDRSDRQDRRRQGKSDPLDAVSAARAAQSGRAGGAPEGPRWHRRGDPRADGRQAQRPLRADPDAQPGQGPDPDRARGPAGPVRPAHRGCAGGPDRGAAAASR
jgi:transposase